MIQPNPSLKQQKIKIPKGHSKSEMTRSWQKTKKDHSQTTVFKLNIETKDRVTRTTPNT